MLSTVVLEETERGVGSQQRERGRHWRGRAAAAVAAARKGERSEGPNWAHFKIKWERIGGEGGGASKVGGGMGSATSKSGRECAGAGGGRRSFARRRGRGQLRARR